MTPEEHDRLRKMAFSGEILANYLKALGTDETLKKVYRVEIKWVERREPINGAYDVWPEIYITMI